MRTIAAMIGLLPAGCASGTFACSDDAQCGAAGVCEPEGWCSFPDADCPDGRRFGAHAGDGLGGACVPARDDTGTTSTGATTTTTTVTSLDATSVTASTSSSDEATSATNGTSTGVADTTGTPADSSSGGGDDPDLLIWLDFDDAAAPWADESGHGHDASCDACPTLEDGPLGPAARFDGLAQHLVVATTEPLEMSAGFTLAAWVHADAIADGSYRDVLTRTFGETHFDTWALGFPPAVDAMRFVVHDGVAQPIGGDAPWPVELGWHHVAATWDGSTTQIWRDGVAIGSNTITTVLFDEHPVVVGADLEAGVAVNFFAGAVDDVRVYARALDEAEIAALAGR